MGWTINEGKETVTKMMVERLGDRVYVTAPLGFDFDNGRLVMTRLQARDLRESLTSLGQWQYNEGETENEDG